MTPSLTTWKRTRRSDTRRRKARRVISLSTSSSRNCPPSATRSIERKGWATYCTLQQCPDLCLYTLYLPQQPFLDAQLPQPPFPAADIVCSNLAVRPCPLCQVEAVVPDIPALRLRCPTRQPPLPCTFHFPLPAVT